MIKSFILLVLLSYFTSHCFPYEDIQCSSPVAINSLVTGTRLTLGSHNKTGDFVHLIGAQYVVLSDNQDVIVYPEPPQAYDLWDVCNCGIRNNASSFFLRPESSGDIKFTGYMFLESPYAAVIPVPTMDKVVMISVPGVNCSNYVLTVKLEDNTVEAKEISADEELRKLQYWTVSTTE